MSQHETAPPTDEAAPPTDEAAPPTESAEDDWRPAARLAATRFASGLWAGLLSGAVIGGIGGRLAMFVLRVTSDPSVVGLESDDGFIIGSFTGSTMFLIVITAVLGLLGGIFYLLIRGWFPQKWRPVVMGVFGAAVGGALFVHPDGIDFTLLEPAGLAIGMFVALPALYGVAMSLLAERLLRSAEDRAHRRWILIFLPLLPIAALGPLGILILLVSLGVWSLMWVLGRSFPIAGLWRSPVVSWLGRAALAAVVVFAGNELIRDSIEIL